jgi:hypothetical protein
MIKYNLINITVNYSPVETILLIILKKQNDGCRDCECWKPGMITANDHNTEQEASANATDECSVLIESSWQLF